MDSQQQREHDIAEGKAQFRKGLELVAQQIDQHLERGEPVALVVVASTPRHLYVMAPTAGGSDELVEEQMIALLNNAAASLLMGNSDSPRTSVPL